MKTESTISDSLATSFGMVKKIIPILPAANTFEAMVACC
jgi:hypothetical protein